GQAPLPLFGNRRNGECFKPYLRRKGSSSAVPGSRPALAAGLHSCPIRDRHPSHQGPRHSSLHRPGFVSSGDYPALRITVQDRGLLQAGCPYPRHLRLSFLDAGDDSRSTRFGKPVSPPKEPPLPKRRPQEDRRLPSPHPDRPHCSRAAPLPFVLVSSTRLVLLRLLDPDHSPRGEPVRAGNGCCPAAYPGRISRGSR